ncbi:terminase small subunit [Levilactobacillus brevis]|uniref:terminase small subunit n=1 Tax=Levilactobacillus brevis TaxID=1580 RepID=UPI0008483350|nr:terminase small subunit [Levilactobacillus brevis]ODP95383.1 hypothetical protein BGC39_13895 [Levilactobacillus brevis]
MARKLTPKQQKFADSYVEGGNAYQAAIDAGYSHNYAKAQSSKLLENVGIKSYIDVKMAEIESDKIMGATEAIQRLSAIARGKIKETVITSTPDGVSIDEKPADFKTQIAAMREILKRHPSSDKLLSAQIRKMMAEASIAEAKAAGATNSHSSQMDTLDQLLTTITKETLEDDEEGRDEIGQEETGRTGADDKPQATKPSVHPQANDGSAPRAD